jgi:tetratricopeptide (TPR) repeat protein
MRIKKCRHWGFSLMMLGLSLVLSGCLETMSSSVSNTTEPPGPQAYEYREQAEVAAQEGLWLEAAALSDKAAQRSELSIHGLGSTIAYWARSADYLKMAGQLEEARVRWKKAADLSLLYVQQKGEFSGRGIWLNYAAKYLSRAGEPQQAQALWHKAAQAEKQYYLQQPPSKTIDIARSLFNQGEYLYRAGDTQAAVTVLQSALPWAQKDWDTPHASDDLSMPYLLNDVESLLGEALLSLDKMQADVVFERLWSRRDHSYTIDLSGASLWRAGKALQKAGDYEFAKRMYLAAVQTTFLNWIGGSVELETNHPLVTELHNMGFEPYAEQVEERLNEAKTLNRSEMLKQAKTQAQSSQGFGDRNTVWQRNQMLVEEMHAQGYEYFQNQRLADAFWRKAAVWENIIKKQDATYAAEDREEQARLARRQAEKEEGSLFLSFIDALGSGIQAYAGARQSGAAPTARIEAAIRAASESSGQGNYQHGEKK